MFHSLTLASVASFLDHIALRLTCNLWQRAKDNTLHGIFVPLTEPNPIVCPGWIEIGISNVFIDWISGFIEMSLLSSRRWVEFFLFFHPLSNYHLFLTAPRPPDWVNLVSPSNVELIVFNVSFTDFGVSIVVPGPCSFVLNPFGYLHSADWAQICVSESTGFIKIPIVPSLMWVDFFFLFFHLLPNPRLFHLQVLIACILTNDMVLKNIWSHSQLCTTKSSKHFMSTQFRHSTKYKHRFSKPCTLLNSLQVCWPSAFFLWSRCSTFKYLSPHSQAWILVENRYKLECSMEYLVYYCSLRACFCFLSPSGSLLPLHFVIFVLNLILMMGFEESGVTVIFIFTSCFTWHYQLSYCLDNEDLSLTFFPYFDHSFILIFVAISFLRLSPELTWTTQSTLSR